MTKPLVTIACVPREVFSTTRRTLETLYERTHTPFDLVCVDGGSPPDVRSYLKQAAREKGFTLLRTDRYLTPTQARNLALERVSTPYVAFVDNDVLVSDGWLKPLLECAEQTGAWAVGPLYFEFLPEEHRLHMAGGTSQLRQEADGTRYYFERHQYQHMLIGNLEHPIERQETELLEWHTLLVSMAALEKIGPLDEGMFCHAEHADISLTIRQAGGRLFLEPRSKITYAPPTRLSPTDRDYWGLRWSEAWCEASQRRQIQKWNLAPHHQELDSSLVWLREHRRYASRTLIGLKALLGVRITAWMQTWLLNRLEILWSRWRYPTQKFRTLQPLDVTVVYVPDSTEESGS